MPLDRTADYGPVFFTDTQWERLRAAFPRGACDFTQPSLQLTPTVPWNSYAAGSGGIPLGKSTVARPVG